MHIRRSGHIVMANEEKGFGFIKEVGAAPGSKGIFFHATVLEGLHHDTSLEGKAVTFEVEDGHPRGPRARHVRAAE